MFERIVANDLRVGTGDKVLDLGCGCGAIAEHIAERRGRRASDAELALRRPEAHLSASYRHDTAAGVAEASRMSPS